MSAFEELTHISLERWQVTASYGATGASMVSVPMRARLPLLTELGDSKSHPTDRAAIQGIAI